MNDTIDAGEVCLIDDDPSVLRSMRNLLVADGLRVRPFNKPQEFLAHAANNPVAVVITDIWMEGVTGLEILARMCALNPRPQVIVITGREDLAARATATAIGPIGFFTKPFNDDQFIGAVRDALAKAGQAQPQNK